MVKILLEICNLFMEYIVVATTVNVCYTGYPYLKISFKLKNSSYMIKQKNYAETQHKMECSGFSSAYVYRHLGKAAQGQELYDNMGHKQSNGYVYCKELVKLAQDNGFYAKLRIGNLTALKNTVAKGVPVIVLVRSKIRSNGMHYVPVVGYDNENIYICDSIAKYRNEETEFYNRKVKVKDFLKLWNTSKLKHPLITHIFIQIRHEK